MRPQADRRALLHAQGAIDPDSPRERDLRKRLRNEQGEKSIAAKRLDDYQLQMALDYLRSWSVFSQQVGKK